MPLSMSYTLAEGSLPEQNFRSGREPDRINIFMSGNPMYSYKLSTHTLA